MKALDTTKDYKLVEYRVNEHSYWLPIIGVYDGLELKEEHFLDRQKLKDTAVEKAEIALRTWATEYEARVHIRECQSWGITRFSESSDGEKRSDCVGFHYAAQDQAISTAYTLAKIEHNTLGWPIGDERIQYPKDHADFYRISHIAA